MSDVWTLQQNSAPIHTADHTCNWFDDNDELALNWPARSLELNINRNVWRRVVREVYTDGKRFESKIQLDDAVFASFMNLDAAYVRNLEYFMPRRCLSLIDRKEAMIDY